MDLSFSPTAPRKMHENINHLPNHLLDHQQPATPLPVSFIVFLLLFLSMLPFITFFL